MFAQDFFNSRQRKQKERISSQPNRQFGKLENILKFMFLIRSNKRNKSFLRQFYMIPVFLNESPNSFGDSFLILGINIWLYLIQIDMFLLQEIQESVFILI
jgi:hypothetical protein